MKRDCACPRARHQHGTRRAYAADRCRCEPCRAASNRAQKIGRHQIAVHGTGLPFVPPVGIARRLQSLAAIGWSAEDLAPLLGTSSTNVIRWRSGDHHAVARRTTLARVAAVYDDVWDKPAPGRYAAKVRNLAARHGWLPPLAYDDDELDKVPVDNYTDTKLPATAGFVDEIAVAEAIAGRKVTLTRAELTETIATMTGMGLSAKEIAERIGTTTRRVTRTRSAASPIREYRKVA